MARARMSRRQAWIPAATLVALGIFPGCVSAHPSHEPTEVLLLRDYFAGVHDDTLKITDGPGIEAGGVITLDGRFRADNECEVGKLNLIIPSSLVPRPGDRELDTCDTTGFFLGTYRDKQCELMANVHSQGLNKSFLSATAWCRSSAK
jgi:hypothetical protein